MKLEQLYKAAVAVGVAHDLRGREAVERELRREAEAFRELKEEDKADFDPDRLFNPYADTRILNGDPALEVRRIMIGVDIDVGEILMAHVLNKEAGRGGGRIDLVLGHHPMGAALVRLYDVMKLQARIMSLYGVTISVAEQLMEKRIGEVERRLLPVNATREVDAARVLGVPLMCIHTAADNCVTDFLTCLFEREKPDRLKDLLKLLKGIPEYRKAAAVQAGPRIVSGTDGNSCGRILVDMTGGTSGSKDIFDKLAAGGVSTIVGMHMAEEHLTNAKKANVNVVIAGHISSDVLGLNLLLDEVERRETLDFLGVSGFERIRRPAASN